MPNSLILAPDLLQALFPDLLSICSWGSALGFHAAHNSAQTPQGIEHENFLEGLVFDMEDERLEELRCDPFLDCTILWTDDGRWSKTIGRQMRMSL